MKARLLLASLGLGFVGACAWIAHEPARVTECGPRTHVGCPVPGCECPFSSHTHEDGRGPSGRKS